MLPTTIASLAILYSVFSPSSAGSINSVMDKPLSNGEFKFYGASGRGACGLDIPPGGKSAAASGSLFDDKAQWVPSTLPDNRYVLDDPICRGICVTVEYKGSAGLRTITVPVNNKCPECPQGLVDLSEAAFNELEPEGGKVGHAKGATLTYHKCTGSEAGGNSTSSSPSPPLSTTMKPTY